MRKLSLLQELRLQNNQLTGVVPDLPFSQYSCRQKMRRSTTLLAHFRQAMQTALKARQRARSRCPQLPC